MKTAKPPLADKTIVTYFQVVKAVVASAVDKEGEQLHLPSSHRKIGKHVSADCKTLYVRQSVWNSKEQDPKTENAVRDIDVCSELAVMLKSYIGNRTNGFLFHTDSGKPLSQRNILRDGLNPILTKLNLKQDGKAFHSFRRFWVMHLRKNRVPWDLEKFWIGHANKDVTDKYAAQLKEDVEWRKDVAEKTGLGFALSASIEIFNWATWATRSG
jgi:hypothetical protein